MRASELDRRAKCPGSARMEKGLPNEDTPESREGTDLHWSLAHSEYDRSVIRPHLQDLLRTADELDERLFDLVIQNEKITDSEEYVEQREVEGEWDGLTGHMDLVRHYPKRSLTVIRDSKFGYVQIERAEFNMQLRGYATMSEDDTVYVAIVQPRASFNQRLTVARYTHQDVLQARHEIVGIMEAANYPDAPLRPGSWCRYCKARAFCPALKEAVTNSLVPVDILSPDLSKAAKLGRIEARLAGVSDQDLGKMIEAYALINFVYDPLMDEARRRIEAGQLEDYKLGKPMERRKIVDSQKAITLLALAGMSREQIMECANLSLTKLEAMLNHGTLRSGKVIVGAKDAKEFTTRVLSSVLDLEVGKPRVLRK